MATIGRLPDPPADTQVLRVSCEVAPAALRPLLEARRLTEAILGESRPGKAKPRARTLFGDTQERATEAVIVDLWNRLARQKGSRWVMVFDAVERADPATLAALAQIVRRAEWLELPLLLVFHEEPREAAAELLAAVRARDGAAVVQGEAAAVAEAPAIDWRGLPPKVLRTLRAGALVGPGFEVKIVAELLGVEPVRVLEQLQRAIDLGIPLEDRGEGRFSLPAAALSALSGSIMPSLAQAWHRQLGRLLGARAAKEAATPPPPPPAAAARLARLVSEGPDDARVFDIIDLSHEVTDVEDAAELAAAIEAVAPGAAAEVVAAEAVAAEAVAAAPAATDEPPVLEDISTIAAEPAPGEPVLADSPAVAPVGPGLADSSAGSAEAGPPAEAPVSGDTSAPRRPVQRRTVLSPPPSSKGKKRTLYLSPEVDMPAPAAVEAVPADAAAPEDPLVDAVRAAEHMRLAGDLEASARHLCEAARKAGESGAPLTAVQHANAALELLATLPPGPSRQRLKARALLELGRVQWQAPGFEHGFTLARARASLEAARAELDAEPPVELAVDLAQALAGVHFDLGDPASLARALAELEDAGARLQGAGDSLAAAGLFNDQAAVRIRMGDARGALQLLRASRAVFDARVGEDAAALRELAESEHLFAQLPLHSRMRMGREEEGYAVGLEHALAAERVYRELGEVRELARVWETIGRIELKRLKIEEARTRLEAAFEAQAQIGDLTGLAQTTEFLSEVLAWFGRNVDAVAMLRDSVVHNRDKGSPGGLASNRRAFEALASRFAQLPDQAEGLREIEVLLAAGERELGVAAAQ